MAYAARRSSSSLLRLARQPGARGVAARAAAPEPYAPTTAAMAWENHFSAFGAQDVDKIMLDYKDYSVLKVKAPAAVAGRAAAVRCD